MLYTLLRYKKQDSDEYSILTDTFDTIWISISKLMTSKANIKKLMEFEKSLITAMEFWGDKFQDHRIRARKSYHVMKKKLKKLS